MPKGHPIGVKTVVNRAIALANKLISLQEQADIPDPDVIEKILRMASPYFKIYKAEMKEKLKAKGASGKAEPDWLPGSDD